MEQRPGDSEIPVYSNPNFIALLPLGKKPSDPPDQTGKERENKEDDCTVDGRSINTKEQIKEKNRAYRCSDTDNGRQDDSVNQRNFEYPGIKNKRNRITRDEYYEEKTKCRPEKIHKDR